MGETFKNLPDDLDAPTRNCRLGMMIRTPSYELDDAIRYGKSEITRKATFYQRAPGQTGCSSFATEEVTFIYDDAGNTIDYDMPEPDPEMVLLFSLYAGLVRYGIDIQNIFIATQETAQGDSEDEQLAQSFDTFLQSVGKANRGFFPPKPIMVEGKPYEVAAVTLCNNFTCIYNLGKMTMRPLPMVAK